MLALPENRTKMIVKRNKTVCAEQTEKKQDTSVMFYFNSQEAAAPPLFLFPNLKDLPQVLRPRRYDGRV
jgi:hypothetical protein